jgi:hypothetical protein
MTTLAEAMRWAEENTGLSPFAREHYCTDYELCPVCLLCLDCCQGHGHAGD